MKCPYFANERDQAIWSRQLEEARAKVNFEFCFCNSFFYLFEIIFIFSLPKWLLRSMAFGMQPHF